MIVWEGGEAPGGVSVVTDVITPVVLLSPVQVLVMVVVTTVVGGAVVRVVVCEVGDAGVVDVVV